MSLITRDVYIRLSAIYFFFFASVGIFLPYWSLYLQAQGFSASEIGELMAVLLGTWLLSPNVWGWLVDHFGHRTWLIQIASLLTILTFAGMYLSSDYLWMMLVMFVYGFFWHASLPQIEALTMSCLGENRHHYGRIRFWGTLGFGICILTTGYMLELFPIHILPSLVLVALLLTWLASLILPPDTSPSSHTNAQLETDKLSLHHKLRDPAVISILLLSFLVFFSQSPSQAFYGVYLESMGYSRKAIGWFGTLSIVSEVLILLFLSRLLQLFRLRLIFMTGIALHFPGLLLFGYQADVLFLMLLAHVCLAAGNAFFNATAIMLIHQYFTGRLQGRGQALFMSAGVGAGLMIGALLNGHIWEMTDPHTMFGLAACVAAIAWLIAYWRVQ